MTRTLIIFILKCIFVGFCCGTLSPPIGKKSGSKSIKPQSGQKPNSVYDRGLVDEKPLVRDILKYHQTYHQDTTTRYFNNSILGYVTPWNNKGYDIAKTWAPKFNYISPVWLQIKRQSANVYLITGLHDVDHAWMKTLKQRGSPSNLRILPRILFDNWQPADLTAFFEGPKSEQEALIKEVKKTCRQWKFDGIVLEILSQAGKYMQHAVDFTKLLGLELAEANFDLILVYPPYRGYPRDDFFVEAFDALYQYVTGFSLMTYDFSNPQNPGANAPLYWMKICVEKLAPESGDVEKRSKILLGLNFYGNSYTPNGGGPIVGAEYIELLQSAKSTAVLSYTSKTGEHYMEVRNAKGTNKIFYPTLYSIKQRLDLATELGTGIAIWELGQGLEYFYDLL